MDGYYRFQSKSNGLYMDVAGGIASDETNIQCYTSNTSNAQKFVLQRGTYNGKEYEKPTDNNSEIVSQRAQVISYMNEMATIPWTPSVTFLHWSGGRNWTKGTTYYGIPYTQKARNTSLESFRGNLSGSTYIGPAGQYTYTGSDCSSAISFAYQKANSSYSIKNTYGMFPPANNSGMRKVGNYNDSGMATLNSSRVCRNNGIGVMKAAYKQLQPSDLVLATEHVMMVTEVGNDYVKVTHQTTYNSTLRSTWRVNEKWSFDRLYQGYYIPVTLSIW